jgi:hypothetical protein
MMEIAMYVNHLWSRWAASLVGLLSVLLVACGAAATPTPQPTATVQAVQPTLTSSPHEWICAYRYPQSITDIAASS